MIEQTFAGTGGHHIDGRSWLPEGRALAVVVIVHGSQVPSGLYEWPASQMVQRGLVVHAAEVRGPGKLAVHVDDVHRLVRIAKARTPGLPLFMLAPSAGGAIGSVYAREHQRELAGFICESFAHEVLAPELPLLTLPLLILHGTRDDATWGYGNMRLDELGGSSDKTLKLYDGHAHDLLSHVGKGRVMADILEWIARRITSTASRTLAPVAQPWR